MSAAAIDDSETRRRIEAEGFALVPASRLAEPRLVAGAGRVAAEWDQLQPDRFMADGGRYRLRRFGLFRYTPGTDEFVALSGRSYFQPKDLNPLNGGVAREFAPLRPGFRDGRFLRRLIAHDFRQFPVPARLARARWRVDVHLIRILARRGEAGRPSPEGIHRDGEMLIAQHFFGRRDAEGGDFSLYDDDDNELARWRQQARMDSVYFVDAQVRHCAGDIVCAPGAAQGCRDVLLVGFDPERPETSA